MKYCVNCIYKEEATSIYDFYQKTLTMPNMKFWGLKDFAYKNWLCSNPKHCRIDHTNNSIIRRPCEDLNFYGSCINYLQSDAINIEPSTINIICEQTEFQGNEEAYITTEIIPFFIPEETEIKINEETGEEEIIITKERYDTDQVLKYKYQWYKNNRKLFKETKDKVLIDTTKDSIDTYYCKVTQILEDNGDGGKKVEITTTKSVIITVDVPDGVPDIPDSPEYTKPKITLGFNPTKNLYNKVTESLNEITISANVTKGLESILNVKFYVNNEVVHTLTEEVSDGGVFSYKHTFAEPQNTTFTVKVSCEDSETHTVVTSGSGTITFIPTSYYGVIEQDLSNPDETFVATSEDIKKLSQVLKTTKTYTYSDINATYGRVVYAYPSSLGELTAISDVKTGWDMTGSFTKATMQIDGYDYFIYYLTDNAGGTGVGFQFK